MRARAKVVREMNWLGNGLVKRKKGRRTICNHRSFIRAGQLLNFLYLRDLFQAKVNSSVMGYMGFGMRKEDYTRKPKKSFDKLKARYGKELNIPHVDPVAGEVSRKGSFQRREFKHFYQTRIFKATRLLVVATGLWLGLLKGYWFQYREYRYQKSGILAEYSAKKNMYLNLHDYFRKREGRLLRFEAYDYDSTFFLSIKDVRRNIETPDSLCYDWREWGMQKDAIKPVVKGRKLLVGIDQLTFDYWQCDFSDYK